MPSIDVSVALVSLAPLLAALLAPLVFRFAGAMAGVVLGIVPASVFVFLCGFVGVVAEGQAVAAGFEWIPAYGVRFSFFIDGLGLVLALLISGIGTLAIVYSGAYLAGHPHQGRFLAFMLAFTGAMLGLVLADDMIALIVFWHLAAVASFLLIGFDHRRQAARRAAIQSLAITGGGGLVLLAGLVVLQVMTGTWALSEIRPMGEEIRATGFYLPVLLMVLAGAFTMSAQVPFHFWLPNAMEAPAPASAFVHGAAMGLAGIYLLARMVPILGGTSEWSALLGVVGGVTLVWGAVAALRQTDLKQMLAQTTIASLGLMVLLLGLGTEPAIVGALLFLLAHAVHKAALLFCTGTVEQRAGTRDITALGGLGRAMPLTFLGAVLAAISMAGLWPAAGFLAGERFYAAAASLDWRHLLALLVLVAGAALLTAVGLAVALLPFLGPRRPTPIAPREGSPSMVAGPLILGVPAVVAALAGATLGPALLDPAAAAIAGRPVEAGLTAMPDFGAPGLYLVVLTWALGGLVFWRIELARTLLRRAAARIGWSFDAGFDRAMSGLVRVSGRVTGLWHHGRLDLYVMMVFVALAAVLYVPLLVTGAVPPIPSLPDLRVHEWGVLALALAGLGALVLARDRLVAVVTLGALAIAVALIFLSFGAPDLALTQFLVGTFAVVILALVMARMRLGRRDGRTVEAAMRDGGIAIVCGLGAAMLMWAVLQTPLDPRLPDFLAATSVPVAHGHNIVNAVLADYRGIDTLGKIAALMTAGIVVLALIRLRADGPPPVARGPRRGRRRAGGAGGAGA